MSSWIKAGLIGAAVLVVFALLGLIPCVGCITWILGLLVYAGTGALAAHWMPLPREAGPAAGQGALAASLAALIGGIVDLIVTTIQTSLVDTTAVLSQMPAESLAQLEAAGMDPSMLVGPGAGALYGSICCASGLILAAILGALGGAIFAAVKPD
jgi:hypothetical protein